MKKILSLFILFICIFITSYAQASVQSAGTPFYAGYKNNTLYWGGGFSTSENLQAEEYTLFIAFYSNDRLIAMDSVKIDGRIKNYEFLEQKIDISYIPKNLTAKVFAWSGSKMLTPLSSPINAKIDQYGLDILCCDIVSYGNGLIEYYDKFGNLKSTSVDARDILLFYNGKEVEEDISGKLIKWINPTSMDFIYGYVVLIDSNGDDIIDIVKITDYDYLVALRSLSSSDYTVTNKMKFKNKENSERILDGVTLDPKNSTYSFTIIFNFVNSIVGMPIDTTDIKASDVVMVATSEDETYYSVRVCRDKFEGYITGFSESDNTIFIDGQEYKMTNDCIAYLNEQGLKIEDGYKGQFYCDMFGNIAYATLNVSTDSTTTVYLVGAVYDEDTEGGSLGVYVPNSGYKTYPLDDKVKLDGETSTPEEVIYYLRDNSENFADKTVYNIEKTSNANQLIKIDLEGNTVKEIYTVDVSEAGTTKETAGLKMYIEEPMKFEYNANTFTSTDGSVKFFTNSSTTFIYVPENRTEVLKYRKVTTSYFDKSASYIVEAYNVNDSNVAETVLIYKQIGDALFDIADDVCIMATEPNDTILDGAVLKELKFYNNTDTLTKRNIYDSEVVADLGVGDVFRYVMNGDNEECEFCVDISYADILDVLKEGIYDWNDDKFNFETEDKRTDGTGLPYVTANVYNAVSIDEGGTCIIVTKDGFEDGMLPDNTDTALVPINGSTTILKMSEAGDEILSINEETGGNLTIEDILTAEYDDDACSKVLITTQANDYARLIVIYE